MPANKSTIVTSVFFIDITPVIFSGNSDDNLSGLPKPSTPGTLLKRPRQPLKQQAREIPHAAETIQHTQLPGVPDYRDVHHRLASKVATELSFARLDAEIPVFGWLRAHYPKRRKIVS
jgi:hypothetical protein